MQGNFDQHWWWQSLFPNLERAQTIARIWIKAAEFAPTALQLLVKKGVAAEFANKLQADESKDLLKQIIETFGLSKLQNALFSPMTKDEIADFQKIIENKQKDNLKKQLTKMIFQNDFLSEIVSETHSQHLTFERKILLAVGLLLAREPRVVRSTEFARQVRQLKIETEVFQNSLKKKTETISEQKIIFEKKVGKINETLKLKKEKKSQLSFSKPEIITEKNQTQKTGKALTKTENTENQTKEKLKVFSEPDSNISLLKEPKVKAKKISFEKSKVEKSPETEEGKKQLKDLPSEEAEKFPDFSAETEEETETKLFDVVIRSRYGGVFYLLNLGLYLGLYRDFSANSGEEIDLNIWDFVALSGYEFLGEDFKEDAVWSLLADLAGRGVEKDFGRDFRAPDEWVFARMVKNFSGKQKMVLVKK